MGSATTISSPANLALATAGARWPNAEAPAEQFGVNIATLLIVGTITLPLSPPSAACVPAGTGGSTATIAPARPPGSPPAALSQASVGSVPA